MYYFRLFKMLIREGKFSVQCFLSTVSIIILIQFDYFLTDSSKRIKLLNLENNFLYFLLFYCSILTCYLKLKYSGFLYQVGIRSVFLGGVFSFGIYLVFYSSVRWRLFGLYICVMSFFHYSEFLAIAWCNPKTLSISSFLLNHSPQYNLAATASWVEFALEVYFVPEIKRFYIISCIGFILCIVGEAFRKIAMITGSTNFTHSVQIEKNDNHELITHGIYSLCRHPSYVGWFYWSIGTQVLLLNPICIVGYTIISWRFFRERITHEEHTLLYFFGTDYINYQKSVGTGLPGIKGFLLDD